MKCGGTVLVSVFILIWTILAGYAYALDLTGPYLGQPSPGLQAQVFAPGIISVRNRTENNVTFTPDGRECCVAVWSNNKNDIEYTRQLDGQWLTPTKAYFQGGGDGITCQFTPDGLGFALVTSRRGQIEIWMSQRAQIGANWPTPLPLPAPVNLSSAPSWEPSFTLDRTLYLVSSDRPEKPMHWDDIFRARYEEGQYTHVENLGPPISTLLPESTAFIAVDESYILYTSQSVNQGKGFCISFHNPDDTWTPPIHLGLIINSSGLEFWPYVTVDRKYFFFTSFTGNSTSSDSDIYWMEARAVLPDPNGTIENLSTGMRFGSIQCAVRYASDGDTILVEPGIYEESFTLNKDIVLQSVDPNDPFYIGGTIIQGDPNEPVVTLSDNTASCTLAGLTLRAGSVGISGTTTDATIRNCRIMDNVTHGVELSDQSNPHLVHCLITANGGSGILMHVLQGRVPLYCKPVIEDCVIEQNGEESLVGGEPEISNSIIEE